MAEGTAKTIDQLPTRSSILGTDYLPLDDGTQSYKTTWAALLALTGGIATATVSGNTITITTKGNQTYTLTLTDSSKQDVLTFDATPTDGSSNPVTSDGVYDAVHAVSVDLAGEVARAQTAEGTNASAIGSLANLTTDAQSDLVSAINEIDDHTDTNTTNTAANTTAIGTIADLTTDATALVSAVNEVDSHTDTNTTAIGTITNLDTTHKANLVEAVNEVYGMANLGFYIDANGDICQE